MRAALAFSELDTLSRNPKVRLLQQPRREHLQFAHAPFRPFAVNSGERGRDMDTASTGGRFPRSAERINSDELAQRVSFVLQAWGRDKSAPISRIQKIGGVGRKTAAAWYYGENAPRSDHLVNLARRIPELKGEVRRLFGLEDELTHDFQRAMHEVIRLYQRGQL